MGELSCTRVLAPWLLASTIWGCGDDKPTDSHHVVTQTRAATASFTPGLQAGDVASTLAALRQGHRHTRASVGPHRMTVHSQFTLIPVGEAATAEPAVGDLRASPQSIEDDWSLTWASDDPHEVRFALQQSNDHDHGREVVILDDQMYTRHPHRDWYVQPLQSDLWTQWLDDGQAGPFDVLTLAAPRLALAAKVRPKAGLGGNDAVELTLSRGPTAAAGFGQAWRATADLEEIGGTLVIDAGSGQWLTADLHVVYSMPGPDGRTLRGTVNLVAKLEPLTVQTAQVGAPTGAQPILEQTRYEVERRRLLDGLAGP